MDSKILFISHRTEDAQFCNAIARTLGLQAMPISRPDLLTEALLAHPKSVVFLDADHDRALDPHSETSIHALLDRCVRVHPSRIFALADKSVFELPKLSRLYKIGNYLLRRYDPFCMDWMPKVVTHALQEDSQELQSFKDKNAKEVKIKMNQAHDKAKTLMGVEKLLTAKGMNERCIQMVLQATDELIMNAIFDAPMDDKGRPYRKSNLRDENLSLLDKEEVEVGIVLNDKTVLVHVKDNFGSFSSDKAMSFIEKDYGTAGYKTDAFTQSAGLGLHGVIASGLGLMINTVPKKSTQAVISFPLFENFKSMRNSFRSFSMNVE